MKSVVTHSVRPSVRPRPSLLPRDALVWPKVSMLMGVTDAFALAPNPSLPPSLPPASLPHEFRVPIRIGGLGLGVSLRQAHPRMYTISNSEIPQIRILRGVVYLFVGKECVKPVSSVISCPQIYTAQYIARALAFHMYLMTFQVSKSVQIY